MTMLNPTKENTFEKNYEFAKTNYVYNNNYYFLKNPLKVFHTFLCPY